MGYDVFSCCIHWVDGQYKPAVVGSVLHVQRYLDDGGRCFGRWDVYMLSGDWVPVCLEKRYPDLPTSPDGAGT